jgi:hypothetical protein
MSIGRKPLNTKLNSIFVSALAMQIAGPGLGLETHVHAKISTVDSSTESTTPIVFYEKAILGVGHGDMTKYLRVDSIIMDDMDATKIAGATYSVVDHAVHSIDELLKLEDTPIVGQAITHEQLMADGIDGAKELLLAQAA